MSRELKEKGLIEYEWLFRFYCLVSPMRSGKSSPARMSCNHLV